MDKLIKTVWLIAICIVRLGDRKVMPGKAFECDVDLAANYVAFGSASYRDLDVEKLSLADGVVKVPLPVDQISDDDDGVKVAAKADDFGGDMEPEALANALRTLLSGWLEADPKQADETKWTAASKPRNKSVDAALKFDVSNDDIEPVWAEIVAANTPAAD